MRKDHLLDDERNSPSDSVFSDPFLSAKNFIFLAKTLKVTEDKIFRVIAF